MKNVSMKIMVAGTLTVLAVCVATGCGSSDTINGDIHIESENGKTQNNEIENSEVQNNELQNNEMQNSEIENVGIENNKDVTAFSDALNRLLFENILPDGRAVVFDEDYFMDDNSFAIYDYDGDSEYELIICWDGTSDDNLVEGVYKYEENTQSFKEIYFETLTRQEDTSAIENRNGKLGSDRYNDYYALTETNIELATALLSGEVKADEIFDFSTPRNNHYLARFHSDWPLNDTSLEPKQVRYGIDVSTYQGNIDFNKVKEDGYEFVIVRIGFRGYGSEGNLKADDKAIVNIKNAKAAGLDVGVYFFSQAVSEAEAVEEAEFCFELLNQAGITEPEQLEMPIVFDPESILHDDSRTDDVTGEQFTSNCIAFCDEVECKGFKSMIYANTTWEAYMLDFGKLSDYPIWYADYSDEVQSPYAYEMWQYSEKGQVNGIDGPVDLNIQYIY